MKSKCLICGESFTYLGSHVNQTHKLSSQEYYDRFLKTEGDGFCKTCGKKTKFICISNGYRKFCSSKCSRLNEETKEKYKSTMLEKYGVEHNSKSDENWEKVKKTCLEKYSYSHPMKSKEIKDKIRKTVKERYGVENVFQLDAVKQKSIGKSLQKYGTSHPMKSKYIKEKVKSTLLRKYGVDSNLKIQSYLESKRNKRNNSYKKMIKNKFTPLSELINAYGQGWYKQLDFPREFVMGKSFIPNDYIETIEHYVKESPLGSIWEIEVKDFVRSLKVNFISNDRKEIAPYELDIYIPDMKIAIECNGTWYHSVNNGTPVDYHLDKTRMCENKGIRLIHIFEWEWQNKRSICESIISSALGIYNEIKAEECTIKEISEEKIKNFIDENGLDLYASSDNHFGLFYNSELVQVVSISKENELVNYTIKKSISILNGIERFFSELSKNKLKLTISRNTNSLNDFLDNGWKLIEERPPTPTYYINKERCNKDEMVKQKWYFKSKNKSYRFLKVYDCGQLTFMKEEYNK